MHYSLVVLSVPPLNKRLPQSMGACCILQFVEQDLKANQFDIFLVFEYISYLANSDWRDM